MWQPRLQILCMNYHKWLDQLNTAGLFLLTTISSCFFTFSPVIDFSWPPTPMRKGTLRLRPAGQTDWYMQILFIIKIIMFCCSNFESTGLTMLDASAVVPEERPGTSRVPGSLVTAFAGWCRAPGTQYKLTMHDVLALRPWDLLWRVWQILPSKICNYRGRVARYHEVGQRAQSKRCCALSALSTFLSRMVSCTALSSTAFSCLLPKGSRPPLKDCFRTRPSTIRSEGGIARLMHRCLATSTWYKLPDPLNKHVDLKNTIG